MVHGWNPMNVKYCLMHLAGKWSYFTKAECFSAMRGDDFPSINHDSRAPTPSSVAWMNANLKITWGKLKMGLYMIILHYLWINCYSNFWTRLFIKGPNLSPTTKKNFMGFMGPYWYLGDLRIFFCRTQPTYSEFSLTTAKSTESNSFFFQVKNPWYSTLKLDLLQDSTNAANLGIGIPSGKRLHNYWKSPLLMGKITIKGNF